MRIRILGLAEQDLIDGFGFYEKQDQHLGDYFLDAVYSEIDSLMLYGGIHRVVFGYHRQLCLRFPYGIYYTMDADVVSVWRVLDLRRDPSWITEQLKNG